MPLLLLPDLQDEAFGDFVARVGFAALRQYAQGYVPADKSSSLASVSACAIACLVDSILCSHTLHMQHMLLHVCRTPLVLC
jgi:hypothetical protein